MTHLGCFVCLQCIKTTYGDTNKVNILVSSEGGHKKGFNRANRKKCCRKCGMMSKIDEVETGKQIVLLIELFAIFIFLDQVRNRPVIDNLLLLSRLPHFLAWMDCIWPLIKKRREKNEAAEF